MDGNIRFALWVLIAVAALVAQPVVWRAAAKLWWVVPVLIELGWLSLISTTPADAIRLPRPKSEMLLIAGTAWLWVWSPKSSIRMIWFAPLLGCVVLTIARVTGISAWWAMPFMWCGFSAARPGLMRRPSAADSD